jgi:hypothetical protein
MMSAAAMAIAMVRNTNAASGNNALQQPGYLPATRFPAVWTVTSSPHADPPCLDLEAGFQVYNHSATEEK